MNSEPESKPRLWGRRFAWFTWILTACLALLSILFVFLNHFASFPDPFCCSGFPSILTQIMALACSTVGVLIVSRRPGNSIGWIFTCSGLGMSLNFFALNYAVYTGLTQPGSLPFGAAMAWLASWIWVPSWWLLMTLFLLVFPDGQLPSKRWRPVAYFVLVTLAANFVVRMFRPGPLTWSMPIFDNPFGIGGALGEALRWADGKVFQPLLISGFACVVSLIVRFIGATGPERQQIKWLAYAGGMTGLSLAIASGLLYGSEVVWNPWVETILFLPFIGIPISVSIAILKHHLYDIDLIINRTLVYGALIVSVISLYTLVVGLAGALFQSVGNTVLAIFATGLIAVLFHPLQQRLQRGINRLMYGERDEPYVVLSQLGQRLETILAPTVILSTTVETIGRALKLPFVEIRLNDGQVESVSFGEPQTTTIAFPLSYQSEPIGEVHVAPRSGEILSSADQHLLKDLARQIGIAIHAARATANLQHSRERLVLAREEERRRLRRDLHDDLAPTLASLGLMASTVADLIPINPTRAAKLVKELQAEIRATVGNIRRLVYDLRPPTLDELGLLAAVRERAAQYSNASDGFYVTVGAPAELPALPAAVEVAAYRIVQEALENVSKHARAQQCSIRFANHDGLEIEITDDGIGLPPKITAGIGLRSMRERAEELGGTCVFESSKNAGTRVFACLPMGEFDGTPARPDRG